MLFGCWLYVGLVDVCSRNVSMPQLPEVTDRPYLANMNNISPAVPTCDSYVKPLQADIQLNASTVAAEENMSRVTDLCADHMPVAVTCDVGEFDDFEEEIQER